MHNRAVRIIEPAQLFRVERLLQKLDQAGRTLDDPVRLGVPVPAHTGLTAGDTGADSARKADLADADPTRRATPADPALTGRPG